VDVNVHPAKTEVKFLSEKAVFDCVHYGVLGALNKKPDRPEVQFAQKSAAQPQTPPQSTKPVTPPVSPATPARTEQKTFFRTMTAEEYKYFSTAVADAPKPKQETAAATVLAVERERSIPVRETVLTPAAVSKPEPVKAAPVEEPAQEPEQTVLEMPAEIEWRMVGELYNSYILVEQGEEAFLIDKHAAHERILFEKLKANQEAISSQMLLSPVPVRLGAEAAAELLANADLLAELGFEVDAFGENTVLLRQIPMDLKPEDAADAVESLAADLLTGRRERKDTVRDELLHTVACKAAIKAGWITSDTELLALVKQVMAREDLKYCPHGRPICVSLSKKQLEKQFKRS
jgi:DNA mismatch repair protein MutL